MTAVAQLGTPRHFNQQKIAGKFLAYVWFDVWGLGRTVQNKPPTMATAIAGERGQKYHSVCIFITLILTFTPILSINIHPPVHVWIVCTPKSNKKTLSLWQHSTNCLCAWTTFTKPSACIITHGVGMMHMCVVGLLGCPCITRPRQGKDMVLDNNIVIDYRRSQK